MRRLSINTPWRAMIAVKVILWLAVFIYKTQQYPRWQYEHLLVDYQFGFIKRGLAGALASLAFPKVPLWAVFVIGGGAWLVTLAMFVLLFRRMFGFDDRYLPLFVFTAGSPFFFGNFMQNVGYADIYGCALALALLLLSARSFGYVFIAAACAMLLILIHHIHALMYVPTIGAIVIARYYLTEHRSGLAIAGGVSMIVPIAVLLLFLQFAGSPPIPIDVFEAYMRSRMAGPAMPPIDAGMWYQQLGDEFAGTAALFWKNALRLPVYALVIAAHAPLISYFRRLVGSLAIPLHRHLAWVAVTSVSLAYLVIFITVWDYSRWVSNWAVCMMLLMFAIRSLPAANAADPIPDGRTVRRLGWVVTAIPRIGTTIPF